MSGALSVLLIGCLLQGALCSVVIIPRSIKVLSRSCVTIPCSFEIESSHKANLDNTCQAVWKNDPGTVVFHSSYPQRGELTGNLTRKDCTTTLNNMQPRLSNKYFFRVECNNKLKYDFIKQQVEILFTAVPPRPTLTPSTLRVKEGTSVSLKCSVPAPCLSHPPTLTWTPRLGDSQETLEENQDKTKVKTSVVTFTASHLHHRQEISCTAVYRKQDADSAKSSVSLTANISFAPQILPSSECTKTADQLNCSCETVGNPPPTLQWYFGWLPVNHSDRFAVSSESPNEMRLRSFITVNQPRGRDLSTLLCSSSNSLGSATQQFWVSSWEPPASPESHECSGRVTLTVFIVTVSALTAALVCALLFAISAQRTARHNPTKTQCAGDTSTFVMSQGLTTENGNKVSVTSEEDIYVNMNMIGKSDEPKTHQQDARKSSGKRNEEGSNVIYSSVMQKNKKKKGGRSDHRNPSDSSYVEEERCMGGGMSRSYVSNALEMGSLYGNIVTRKHTKKAGQSEYAQVKFRDKNTMYTYI